MPVGVAVGAAGLVAERDGLLLGDFDGLADGFLVTDGDAECDGVRVADAGADRDGLRDVVGLCAALGVDVARDGWPALGERDDRSTAEGPADVLTGGDADRVGRGDRDSEWLGDGVGLAEASVDTTPLDPWPLPLTFSTAAPIR